MRSFRLAIFDLLHSKKIAAVFLCAFNLIELTGEDFGHAPCSIEKLGYRSCSRSRGTAFNSTITSKAKERFEHACKLGYEGIVAKQKDLSYETGRSKRWLTIKNPDSPAMQRVGNKTF